MYQTVFDIRDAIPWGSLVFVLPGVLFVCLGVVMLRVSRGQAPAWLQRAIESFPGRRRGMPPGLAKVWLGFALFWTVGAFASVLVPRHLALSALEDGKVAFVEGRVEAFDPMPYAGHQEETFAVGDVRFAYSDYRLTAGFNQSRSHGGPIREGLPVRITYLPDRWDHPILKLEIPSTEPVTSEAEPMPGRPRIGFGAFAVFWVGLALFNGWLLFINRNVRLKRVLFPVCVIGGGLAFASFAAQMGAGLPMALVVALITAANLRQFGFCDDCGALLRARRFFGRPGPCQRCHED